MAQEQTPNRNKLVIFDFSLTLEDPNCEVYEGMPEQICDLHDKGYKLAIASYASKQSIEEVLERVPFKDGLTLKDAFGDNIYGPDEMRNANLGKADKTSKLVAEHIIAATDASKARTVVVGDSYTELLMAKNSKLKYLHAGWGDPEKTGLKLGLGVNLPMDETDVEMAKSIRCVEQLTDRIEAELAPKKDLNPNLGPER